MTPVYNAVLFMLQMFTVLVSETILDFQRTHPNMTHEATVSEHTLVEIMLSNYQPTLATPEPPEHVSWPWSPTLQFWPAQECFLIPQILHHIIPIGGDPALAICHHKTALLQSSASNSPHKSSSAALRTNPGESEKAKWPPERGKREREIFSKTPQVAQFESLPPAATRPLSSYTRQAYTSPQNLTVRPVRTSLAVSREKPSRVSPLTSNVLAKSQLPPGNTFVGRHQSPCPLLLFLLALPSSCLLLFLVVSLLKKHKLTTIPVLTKVLSFVHRQSTHTMWKGNKSGKSKAGRGSNRTTAGKTTVLLLSSDLTVMRQPPPTPRGTQPQASPIDEVRQHPFTSALIRDCHQAASGLIAQAVHILGLPNDAKTLQAVLPILADRLGKAGIQLDDTDWENPDSEQSLCFAAINSLNGRKFGALGSSKSKPAWVLPLTQDTPIAYSLHPPDSIAYPPFLIFDIPVALKETEHRSDITYVTITCTMIPQPAGSHLHADTIAKTVTGQCWFHVINIMALFPLLDCALGAIMYDLMALMLEGLSLDTQEELRTNLIMVPFHPAFSQDADDASSLSTMRGMALAIHFRSDSEDKDRYSLLDHVKTVLLGNNQCTSRSLRLNGVVISISTPTDPTNPVNIPATLIPRAMHKPRLFALTLRDLHGWISTSHLALILTHALGLGDKVISILLRTPRIDDSIAHITTRHRPDAMILLDSRESLAMVLRSEDVLRSCIRRLHCSAPHDDPELVLSISSLNQDKRYQLGQLDQRDRGSSQLRDNEQVTFDLINQAAAKDYTLPPMPEGPIPPPITPTAAPPPRRAHPARVPTARERKAQADNAAQQEAAAALAALHDPDQEGESVMEMGDGNGTTRSPPRPNSGAVTSILSPGSTKRSHSGAAIATRASIDNAALLDQLRGDTGLDILQDILNAFTHIENEGGSPGFNAKLDEWATAYMASRAQQMPDF